MGEEECVWMGVKLGYMHIQLFVWQFSFIIISASKHTRGGTHLTSLWMDGANFGSFTFMY